MKEVLDSLWWWFATIRNSIENNDNSIDNNNMGRILLQLLVNWSYFYVENFNAAKAQLTLKMSISYWPRSAHAAIDLSPHLFNNLTLGAFDTFSLDLIHSCTVSLKIWLPHPHTIVADWTKGYKPCMAVSTQILRVLSSSVNASSLVRPCKSNLHSALDELQWEALADGLVDLYKLCTSPTWTT